MSDLTPITREEKLLNGEDLEPITREEKFIRRIYDKKQAVPEPVTRREIFLKKAGEGGGGDVTIEQLNVTQNGEYSEQGKAYSPVIVEVPQPSMSTLEVSENGNYDAPTGTGYNRVEVNVPLPSNAYLLKSLPSTPTDIATISDGANLPMPYLKIGVEPVQDLHGYDAPWVGGAGKNKFKTDFENTTINGTTITKTSDGRVLTSGVPTSAFDFVVGIMSLPAGSYILSGCPANGGATKYRLQVTDYPIAHSLGQDSGTGVAFTLENDMDITVRIQVYTRASASLEYKPMIRLSTVSDSTFAPYSNICPISGWDEAVVTVADDVDNPTVSHEYTIDLDGTRYGGYIEIVNGETRFVATKEYIASYNGETLPSDWISDRDVYSEGATPTIGAEVVYTLATPVTIPLSPTPISTLEGENNLFADSGQILDGEYLSKGV